MTHRFISLRRRTATLIGAALLAAVALLSGRTPVARAATIVVNSSADTVANDGACTLREAITAANTNTASGAAAGECVAGTVGLDVITFSGTGLVRIQPTSALPSITQALIIDGSSKPDFPTNRVEVDGVSAGAVDGLQIAAGPSTVNDLTIMRFSGDCVRITGGSDSTIRDNIIGLNSAGTSINACGGGIRISSVNDITVSGNLISGNGYGITAFTDYSAFEDNFIGTDITGTADLGNTADGILISSTSDHNLVSGNLISGNGNAGINLNHASANSIFGNFIGTNAAGTAALPNTTGIFIGGNADGNVVGGPLPNQRNVISGNSGIGVVISYVGQQPDGNLVLGNLIGTDAAGTAALPNASGIEVTNAGTTVIGGTAPGQGNVISGNTGGGIAFYGTTALGGVIAGNIVGRDVTGDVSLPNGGTGILIGDGAAAQVTANLIADHSQGLLVNANSSPTLNAGSTDNCIIGNANGASKVAAPTVTFENNWWGDPSGPSGAGPGVGDPVGSNLDFDPWLTVAPASCSGGSAQPAPVASKPVDPKPTNKVFTKFKWKAEGGALSFYLLVDDEELFTSPEIDTPVDRTKFEALTPLDYGIYYWTVIGEYEDGFTAWAEPVMFFLTVMKKPANGAIISDTTPGFGWKKVDGALTYDLLVGTDPDLTNVVIDVQDTEEKGFTPATPLAPGTYYWRVSADTGAVMPTWSFTIAP